MTTYSKDCNAFVLETLQALQQVVGVYNGIRCRQNETVKKELTTANLQAVMY